MEGIFIESLSTGGTPIHDAYLIRAGYSAADVRESISTSHRGLR
ncbi:hypothetical protein COMA2_80055 [Candidatus Nitrospira nitrificans]|uniref:Uncharacterized protein n=1 Tax=Candidatus Nitrospira nitrificans TaxID=1742973 RepID=A0A0S4LSB7_9BACT|nr:hypothetical protein COMA2_80055 [Candidatus Nitrospira nitrificans]